MSILSSHVCVCVCVKVRKRESSCAYKCVLCQRVDVFVKEILVTSLLNPIPR